MHAATSDRGGGSGGGSWRLPPDETLQVSTDPKEKLDVSEQINNLLKPLLTLEKKSVMEKYSERATITNEEKRKLNRFFLCFLQELDYGEGQNWKSIILALLVIGCVIAGIVTAIYLLG